MQQQNKFKAVSGKRFFAMPRLPVWGAAIIYLLSVLFLVLLTKLSLASTIDTAFLIQEADIVTSTISKRTIAVFLGLFVAVAFFIQSKRQAYKILS